MHHILGFGKSHLAPWHCMIIHLTRDTALVIAFDNLSSWPICIQGTHGPRNSLDYGHCSIWIPDSYPYKCPGLMSPRPIRMQWMWHDIVPSWTRFYRKGCAHHRQMKHVISTYPKHLLLIRQWQELFPFSKTCTLNPCLDWAYRMELLCNEITHHVPPCSLIDRIHSGVLHESTLRCFKVSSVSLSLDVIVTAATALIH